MDTKIVEVLFEGVSKVGRKIVVGKDENGLFVVKLAFNDEEAKGTVIASEGGYGLNLDVEGIDGAVGSVDLFHPAVGDGGPMLIIDNGDNGDPVGFAHLSSDGTRVNFELGVEVVGETDTHLPIYGYPVERN